MFPKGCVTVVRRRTTDNKVYVCGTPAPLLRKDATESKQEAEVEGYELELGASGTSLWVPAGRVLCVPTEHGLPVQVTQEVFAAEFVEP